MDSKRYKDELISFGRRLKEIRKDKKLSQLDVELRSGINRTEISRIENATKNFEFSTIVKLADALEVEISAFFS